MQRVKFILFTKKKQTTALHSLLFKGRVKVGMRFHVSRFT
jgi:hypothetical protein